MGYIKHTVLPTQRWNHFSFEPWTGMYIRESVLSQDMRDFVQKLGPLAGKEGLLRGQQQGSPRRPVCTPVGCYLGPTSVRTSSD